MLEVKADLAVMAVINPPVTSEGLAELAMPSARLTSEGLAVMADLAVMAIIKNPVASEGLAELAMPSAR